VLVESETPTTLDDEVRSFAVNRRMYPKNQVAIFIPMWTLQCGEAKCSWLPSSIHPTKLKSSPLPRTSQNITTG